MWEKMPVGENSFIFQIDWIYVLICPLFVLKFHITFLWNSLEKSEGLSLPLVCMLHKDACFPGFDAQKEKWDSVHKQNPAWHRGTISHHVKIQNRSTKVVCLCFPPFLHMLKTIVGATFKLKRFSSFCLLLSGSNCNWNIVLIAYDAQN